MKNIVFTLLTVFILTSCSSLKTREPQELNKKQKESLVLLLDQVKGEFAQNRTDTLKASLVPGLRNMMVKNELSRIDTSRLKLFSSEPVYIGSEAENTIAFNMGSETHYYQVRYILEGTDWKISEFKERR